jgi:hypothetical protein
MAHFAKSFHQPILTFQEIIKGKITIKRATQMNGHSLKLHFCMFERSQRKDNSLDCHNFL